MLTDNAVITSGQNLVRLIAFYLPQFHIIPENDEWWGKGFTEWTNVTKAKPMFQGHYQPHLPADLGFYDLRLPEAREAQAALARRYGVHGFCYYHYWFNGRRILERPFADVLASGRPDYPFCLCWANENWTRRWDGCEHEILLGQQHSAEDDEAHILALIPAFQDKRYIRVNDKALMLIYRTELLPSTEKTAEIWRRAARANGVELYLCGVEGFSSGVDPASMGFDAAVEFAPTVNLLNRIPLVGPRGVVSRLPRGREKAMRIALASGVVNRSLLTNSVYRYEDVVKESLSKPAPGYKRFSCVCPSWDNSARKAKDAVILVGSTPDLYKSWLEESISKLDSVPTSERIVFINAWNEWGEGCHLEPDARHGTAYLEATAQALGLT